MGLNAVRKITAATAGLSVKELAAIAMEHKPRPVPVLRVYGRIEKADSKMSTIGPYVEYAGDFEAVNLINGEVFRGKKLILKDTADAILEPQISSAKQDDPNASIQFGLDVTVQYYAGPEDGTHFRYGIQALGEKADDYLTELSRQFGNLPLLNQKEKKAVEDKTGKKKAVEDKTGKKK